MARAQLGRDPETDSNICSASQGWWTGAKDLAILVAPSAEFRGVDLDIQILCHSGANRI